VAASTGYFAADLYGILTVKPLWDVMFVAHHIVIGVAFLSGLYFNHTTICHFFFLLEELSTLFLNIRWFNRRVPLIFLINSALFAITFYIMRGGFGMYYFYTIIRTLYTNFDVISRDLTKPELVQIFLQVFFCSLSRILNCQWFVSVYLSAMNTFKGVNPKKQSLN